MAKTKTTPTSPKGKESVIQFPPVVAVVGHVDHGKTSLLDAIRKSTIAEREHGGITQKIGASSVEILHENIKRNITFIDTPGHQAFSAMRSRGAGAADIGILVVSSSDGVMPQTKESIQVLLAAKIPFIVALTKADLPDRSIEKVKQQLLKEGVMLEGLGGDVPYIEVSAKTNKNIQELLDLILLVFDLHQELFKEKSSSAPFYSIVIESKLDQRAGPKATVINKNGTITARDEITAEKIQGKARTLLNDQRVHVQSASVGQAVEILGFEQVPLVGSSVVKKGDNTVHIMENRDVTPLVETLMHHDENALSIVLVTDTLGSLEAILNALPREIVVALPKTGEVTVSDVLFAKSTKSIIVGFNADIKPDIAHLARTEKILAKNYTIIYELLDELEDVLKGKALALLEEVFGQAKVLASFPFEKTKVLGITVLDGRVAKGDKVRIMRGETAIGESTITSVRHGKEQISKLEQGNEGGIIIAPILDFTIGDVLICHR